MGCPLPAGGAKHGLGPAHALVIDDAGRALHRHHRRGLHGGEFVLQGDAPARVATRRNNVDYLYRAQTHAFIHTYIKQHSASRS